MPVQFRFLQDRSDLVLVAAVALLPVDGTALGIYAPFWTPISPWLFLLYALLNRRYLPTVYHRFRPFFWLPVLLMVLSVPDGLRSDSIPLPCWKACWAFWERWGAWLRWILR